MAVISIA